jgi:hypothetical protein
MIPKADTPTLTLWLLHTRSSLGSDMPRCRDMQSKPDTHQKEIKTQTVAHLRGGTYKSYDPYASKNGYVPEYGVPLVLLNPDEKEIIPFHARNWKRGVEMLGMLRG